MTRVISHEKTITYPWRSTVYGGRRNYVRGGRRANDVDFFSNDRAGKTPHVTIATVILQVWRSRAAKVPTKILHRTYEKKNPRAVWKTYGSRTTQTLFSRTRGQDRSVSRGYRNNLSRRRISSVFEGTIQLQINNSTTYLVCGGVLWRWWQRHRRRKRRIFSFSYVLAVRGKTI